MSDILKKSLVQIANEAHDIETALIESGGEITPEIEQRLAINEQSLPMKVDAYAHMLKRIPLNAEYFRAQAEFFSRVARGIESAEEHLKANLKYAMTLLDLTEIKGTSFRITKVDNKPSVIIEDLNKIDGAFVVTELVVKADKKKIANHIASGGSVEGVRLEQTQSLRIYPNKE